MSVRHALLALLSEGPKYGLQLRQEFEARTGEVWPLNVGQVYTTLQRLERDGLVESDGAERRRPAEDFRITAAGRRRARGVAAHATRHCAAPRDELVIKVLVALRVPGVDVVDARAGPPPAPGRDDAALHARSKRTRPRRRRPRCSSPTPRSTGSTRSSAGSTPPTPVSSESRCRAADAAVPVASSARRQSVARR